MSPAAVNDLVLSFMALLTLLLGALLAAVIRLPPWPALNPAAKRELDTRSRQFEDELRKGALARARARGKEVSKKDVRAENRERRISKTPRALQGITRYGGITLSVAGLAIVVPSLPHFPPLSPGAEKSLSGAGIILAAMAMVYDGSEFLRDMIGRRRKAKNTVGASPEEYGQSRSTSEAPSIEHFGEDVEKELRRCCGRLVKDVEKGARRRAGETEITPQDLTDAWGALVSRYKPAEPAMPAVRSGKESILLGLAALAALIAVAGILYLVYSFAKTKLPAGQYWPAVVIMATLLILYLVLVNGPRAIAAARKRLRDVATTIGTLASGLAGTLARLARKGRDLVGSLLRIRPKDWVRSIRKSRRVAEGKAMAGNPNPSPGISALSAMPAQRPVLIRSHGWEQRLDGRNESAARLPGQARPAQPGWRPGETLTPLEEEMVARAAAGELVDCGEGPSTLAEMQAWEEERTVRAAVLRHLLIAGEWPVDAKGVWLRGARIGGLLDLGAAAVHCPLLLEGCYLDADESACLDYADASRVTLTRCHIAGLSGKMLTVRELDLTGSTLTGPLYLPGADIAGQLHCRGARLAGTDSDGYVLVADGLKAAAVFLDGGFTATGAVRLTGADITGNLECEDAQLAGRDSDGYALVADGLKAGAVFLREVLTADGGVQLAGADITGNLECEDAQLAGTHRDGYALVADGLKASAVFLREGFIADGGVRLARADITGQLDCRGARLAGTDRDGYALVADGLKTGEDVFLGEGFTADGTVSLRSAHVGASVYVSPTALAMDNKVAFNAAGAKIAGMLLWAPARAVSGQVNLEGATAAGLDDDWSSGRPNGHWPVGGQLRLDGFTYGRFGGVQQATVGQRLAWIRRQYQPMAEGSGLTAFATQPYEQLAAVYRQAGQATHAREVAIARRTDLRRHGDLNWYRRFVNWLLDKTIKYGYQSWRAGAALVVLYLVVLALSVVAGNHNVIMPVAYTAGMHPAPVATSCTAGYPCFYPAVYAFDVVIPIINVHQADYWGPNGQAPWGWAWVTGTWIATGFGWALAILLVAGVTGLVRRA